MEELSGYIGGVERFCVLLTGTHEVVGLTREYPCDLFGKWYGPILTPFSEDSRE